MKSNIVLKAILNVGSKIYFMARSVMASTMIFKPVVLIVTIILINAEIRIQAASEKVVIVEVKDFTSGDLKNQVGEEASSFSIYRVNFDDKKSVSNDGWRAEFPITSDISDETEFSWSYTGQEKEEAIMNAIFPAVWTYYDLRKKPSRMPKFVLKENLHKEADGLIRKIFENRSRNKLTQEEFFKRIGAEIRQLHYCVNNAYSKDRVNFARVCIGNDRNLYQYFATYLKNKNLTDEERDRASLVFIKELLPFMRNEFKNNFPNIKCETVGDPKTLSDDIIISWHIQILENQLALLKTCYPEFSFPGKTITEYITAKVREDPSFQSSLNCFKKITKSIYEDLSNADNKCIYTAFVEKYNLSESDKWKNLFSVGDKYLSASESGLRPLTPSGEDNEYIYRLATLDYLVNILKTANIRMEHPARLSTTVTKY